MSHSASLYWHDYETFGLNPKTDRIAQFAGIRTDMDLNIIGKPLVIYNRACNDMLPNPDACLVTGITPQKTITEGLIETEFMAAIHAEFSRPNTCVLGYNNIRFDDEFTRYGLYRNFFDPYAREWQNSCSRWDIIDMVRMMRALRPEGIHWPVDADGVAVNKLELITQLNGISHESAHDALSDVYATIALAKLIRDKQPRLYDYIFQHKDKHQAAKLLNLSKKTPLLHTSGMIHSQYCNTAMIAPLAAHPTNKNAIIVYDLRYDPSALIELDANSIKKYLYTAKDELPEGMERIALKAIHINKCPVIAPMNTLNEAAAGRLDIDIQLHNKHLATILNAVGLTEKIQAVFKDTEYEAITDPDQSLYSGGFFSNDDRNRMQTIRSTPADKLNQLELNFDDNRLDEMLFRFRARNYPHTLADIEQKIWHKYRKDKLTRENNGSSITLSEYINKIDNLLNNCDLSAQQRNTLNDLKAYGVDIGNSLGISN
jgi:exodeoxyribonuclease-1